MSEFPHELIRQVQICSRAAAGLPDYNPSDPTLPALPSLSAAIAAFEPSPPQLRCKNCKGRLLRGLESIICMYCGQAPQNDAVPDPICFTSSIAYHWLLRSLHLDGSEMVEPLTNKSEQDQGQTSPKALTPLSNFLDLKIPWKPEMEKQEASVSDEHSQESRRSLSLTGVAPDNFFFKSKKDVLSDMSTEQPFMHSQIATAGTKDVAAFDHQNLFQNVQSSEAAGSSSKHKTSDALSGWEADFQSADTEKQNVGDGSFGHFTGSSPDYENKIQDSLLFDKSGSGNKLWDSQSIDHSTGLEVDLASHFDSVFGPGKDPIDEKPKDNPAASPPFGDWNSDDVWNNLSNESHFAGRTDATISTNDENILDNSKDLSTSADLFQDFQWQTNNADMTESKTTNEDHKRMDDVWNNLSNESHFAGRTDATISTNDDHILDNSNDLSTSADLFQDFQWQTNNADKAESKITNEDHNTMDDDSFGEWNDFTGSTSLQIPSSNDWIGSEYQVSTSDKKSSELDLFGLENNFEERDFGDFAQPNLFSTSTSKDNVLTKEVIAVASESPASDWLSDATIPSFESGQAPKTSDAIGQSPEVKDDVTMLISQMHDLSFMLESNLSIPSNSDAHNSSPKD
ncbi:hypothetical protein BUALT_Bualt18G0012800 [Buddleja alternifolia]|uniref:DUF7815 domain-containing protein n=1 Tax=Buddleja alternifolia TaxID=168488 RepID=A0AAV6W7S1_9LAMI|nr:hypothetical protein BUALT_Bualt18G0012800 [Buddleja alternifolia]